VNSLSCTPTLRITHSSESTAPVAKAIFGMSPWAFVSGRLVRHAPDFAVAAVHVGSAVLTQEATDGMTV